MSIDALQEKIRKLKCPIVLDLSVEAEHIPQALWESADEKAMTVYCKTLMSGLKGIIPAVRFSFDQFALMGASGLETLRKLLREAHSLGYYVLLIMAALQNIPTSVYEAAEIDGAGYWQKCKYITVPGIKPMIILMSILNIGNIMNAGFEQILVMYNPSVYETGDILDTMGYRIGLLGLDYSMGTAIGLFKAVISCICFIVAYRIAFKVADYRLF